MPLLLNPWLHTFSAFLAPFALRLLPTFRNLSSSQPLVAPAVAPLRNPISALLAFYTLYTLYTLAFARPPNLFTTLHLPLNAPQPLIRTVLLQRNDVHHHHSSSGTTDLPPDLEKLLARLASSDARMILVRFGQRAVQTCAHCATQADYALHALPPALLSYTLAAAVLGAVTVRGTARESRRGIGLVLLVVAALVEAYWAYTVPIRIPSRPKRQDDSSDDIIMWHDTLWSLRHALFLALLLSIHLLPASPRPPTLSTTLTDLHKTSDAQLARAHLLRLSASATQRVPELRMRATAFWTRERTLGTALRRDAEVRAAAERVGLGIAPPEGRALLGSRDYAEAQKRGGASAGGSAGVVEGALHGAARAAVASLKGAVLRSTPSDEGTQ